MVTILRGFRFRFAKKDLQHAQICELAFDRRFQIKTPFIHTRTQRQIQRRKMKVLLVDDSGIMRKIIARALNALWIEDIVEATDGVDALAKFGDGVGFDLLLTDWNMPNMNGLELVTAIRGAGHKLPIMMITTEAEKSQVVAAIQAGVNNYLVKPFDQETLISKLEKVCPNYQRA